ncbi:uncharacterized protein HaLaN_11181 [Haematococcus lacustris]|uniref:Uncharacterized protein n=1 Tax=Haematococcus lacustris TaxID=44745 RepID=A0A699Z723_HAELA|nr:uncharacterized protein HaLaN_11181 [Haematococcus lacustris]
MEHGMRATSCHSPVCMIACHSPVCMYVLSQPCMWHRDLGPQRVIRPPGVPYSMGWAGSAQTRLCGILPAHHRSIHHWNLHQGQPDLSQAGSMPLPPMDVQLRRMTRPSTETSAVAGSPINSAYHPQSESWGEGGGKGHVATMSSSLPCPCHLGAPKSDSEVRDKVRARRWQRRHQQRQYHTHRQWLLLVLVVALTCFLWYFLPCALTIAYNYCWWTLLSNRVSYALPETAPVASSNAPVPKILHQTWRDKNLPARWRAAQQSCIDAHPGYEYRLWTDDDAEQVGAARGSGLKEAYELHALPVSILCLSLFAAHCQSLPLVLVYLQIISLQHTARRCAALLCAASVWRHLPGLGCGMPEEPGLPALCQLLSTKDIPHWHLQRCAGVTTPGPLRPAPHHQPASMEQVAVCQVCDRDVHHRAHVRHRPVLPAQPQGGRGGHSARGVRQI